MGQRGPKPKPAALKLLAGNPGKRPVAPGCGGRVRKGVPDRPPELTGEAAAEWDALAPELDAAGLLAVTDRGILAAYCLAVADMLAARAEIVANGRFLREPIQTSTGKTLGTRVRENPACRMLERASLRVRALGAELGLTPASRSRFTGEGAADSPVTNRVAEIRDRIAAARNGG